MSAAWFTTPHSNRGVVTHALHACERWMTVSVCAISDRDWDDACGIALALPAWFTPAGVASIRADLPHQPGYVAVAANQTAVGFLLYTADPWAARITWTGVHPDHHRRGIGRQLVDRLLADLGARGVDAIRVETLCDSVDYEPYSGLLPHDGVHRFASAVA